MLVWTDIYLIYKECIDRYLELSRKENSDKFNTRKILLDIYVIERDGKYINFLLFISKGIII